MTCTSRPIKNPQNPGAIYAKLNSSDRSQSSMSGDTVSTVSSNGSTNLIKSGSRASLLKENSKENSPPSRQGELKRFKSLPSGKVRRVKRRAPSPPKNQKPYQSPTKEQIAQQQPESETSQQQQQQQQHAQLSLDLDSFNPSSLGRFSKS